MSIAVKVEGLSKKYKLGLTHAGSLRELANGLAARLVGKPPASSKSLPTEHADRVDEQGYFWALKDVNFEIPQGEVVGIIGKNGAGKSTLLKILSRITTPSTGRIEYRGRIASLLEVGTGFHPELTGRENVYMNGTILGMTRKEIDRQFDAIVDFAGVEKFIDTPVKRYSSGMTVRLGFAVAAHLDPEILIVDEVLAVGDAEFQTKCLGKMQEVSRSGRTVLFVSHNMGSVSQLCTQAIFLKHATVKAIGPVEECIELYLEGQARPDQAVIDLPQQDPRFWLKRIRLLNDKGEETNHFGVNQKISVQFDYQQFSAIPRLEIGFKIITNTGVVVTTAEIPVQTEQSTSHNVSTLRCELEPRFLANGLYRISVAAHVPLKEVISTTESALHLFIEDTGSEYARYRSQNNGLIFPRCHWTHA